MASQAQSRLHRLLTLLDTGSTQATRFAAARQIGEIAKSHPQELNYLLKMISPFLHNKKWETRVAAAHAIGAVAESVKLVSLVHIHSQLDAQMQQSQISISFDEAVPYPNFHPNFFSGLLFRSFDIIRVLGFGALLASGGQEYDVVSDSSKDPKERLFIQKHNLRHRLGLDVCEQFMDLNDMITDEDILAHKVASQDNGLKSNLQAKNVQQLVLNTFPRFTSKRPSVRELNLLKRKAKINSKDQGKGWSENELSINKAAKTSKNIILSNSSKTLAAIAGGNYSEFAIAEQWPFQNFVEQLLLDIFNPIWEVRHGSAMALREIFTFQGSSAGVILSDCDPDVLLTEHKQGKLCKESNENEVISDDQPSLDSFEPGSKRQKLLRSTSVLHVEASNVGSCGIQKHAIDIELEVTEKSSPTGTDCEVISLQSLNAEYESHDIDGVSVSEGSQEEPKKFLFKDVLDQELYHDRVSSSGDLSAILEEKSDLKNLLEMARLCWLRNCEVLQDCAVRLLCVLVLDRFGDYVSDQVVAPVRETSAQALGAVLKHMHPGLVIEVLNILLKMQHRPEWEIRHGSLLGIKYLVAVRKEMISDLIGHVLPACKSGLEDADDDVRAVAADALIPAASVIVSLQNQTLHCIVMLLWDILLDLDDLSPSTSSVMNLLAEIYSQEELNSTVLSTSFMIGSCHINLNEAVPTDDQCERANSASHPTLLVTLAPRLWPFMRHTIKSVRYSAIRTLERLLEAVQRSTDGISLSSSWPKYILGDTLRIVFQNLLLESNHDILRCSERVWRLLLQSSETDLKDAACSFYSLWVDLAATPYGSSFDALKMFWPASLPRKNNFREAKVRAVRRDRDHTAADSLEASENIQHEQNGYTLTNVSKIFVGADTEKNVTHMRVVTASALGVLASQLPETCLESIFSILLKGLISLSGVQRQVASLVLISWFKEKKPGFLFDKSASAHLKAIKNSIINLLSCTDPSFPSMRTALPYAELSRTYSKMRLEARQLLHACESCGVFGNLLSTIKIDVEKLAVEEAINFASKLTGENVDSPGELSVSNLILNDLDPVKQRLLTTAGYLLCVQNNLHVSVTTLMAAALVWMFELPVKLNPVILPLMASIKREQAEVLQLQAADALSELICYCIPRRPSPNDKLIRNIFGLLCSDTCETPQTETLSSMEFIEDQDILFFGSTTGDHEEKSASLSNSQEHSTLDGFIGRRGSEFLLRHLCEKLGASLFEKVPKIWDCLIAVLIPANHESLKSEDEMKLLASLESVQDPQGLINNIQIVGCLVTMVHESPRERVMLLFPCIIQCVQHSHLAIRLAASRCVTSIAKLTASTVMPIIIQKIVPMLRDSGSACARHGAGVLVNLLVRELGVVLVPYALLLVVPLLRCMSDCSHSVRQTVTHSFAALVPLLPLARGVPLPFGTNEDLLRDTDDVKFLEQLLDNSNIDDYNLPIELKVTLRRYQQEGINWLAFLRRFKLHGILCDDMGLGKTLQASAIVATDIVERRGDDKERSVSLIVCPSTLVGHWAYEIEKFIDASVINSMQYVGSSQERVNARERLRDHNVVITSYDVVRKDIDYLAKVLWTYCILDEGHIIKNSKSKVARAMKELRAHHRLILTGTPIQNNILDLWSLFDFLMPGFLGSERQFQAMYGKPLSAARDPKCSARDAEAGALAMEALHKQVMPFLLRRTKEDVLSDLPEKIIQDRYCSLSPVQLKLYEQFSGSRVRKEISTMVEEDEPAEDPNARKASSHVFQAMQYLLKLCSHPLLVAAADTLDSLISTTSDTVSAFHELHHAPKLVALKEILEECGIGVEAETTSACVGQHRVLIFAQHKAFLDIIERDLFHTHMKSVTYLRMDGSVETQKRFEIVKAFNSDPTIDVLLLTTHVGGLGLNLTSADTLVFMEHDWNPMRDLQAMDRAHRLGQRKVVNVHRLIMRGSLEEKVMSLQKFKVSVANSVVNSENASLKTMNTEQLLDLFTPAKSLNKKGDGGKEEEGTPSGNGGKRGLKAILSGLEELWDHSQYTEEYNLDHFLAKLNA